MKPKLFFSVFRQIFVILSLFAFYYPIQAQHAFPVAGGNAWGSGGSVSFTVGQVFSANLSAPVGSISQGVQQPYEISAVTDIEEAAAISLRFSAYPNPAGDFLILEMEGEWASSCILKLYDINGNILQNLKVVNPQIRVDMSRYIPAVYFLKVVEGQKELKVFRIVKH